MRTGSYLQYPTDMYGSVRNFLSFNSRGWKKNVVHGKINQCNKPCLSISLQCIAGLYWDKGALTQKRSIYQTFLRKQRTKNANFCNWMIPNYQLTQAKRSMNFFIQRSIKSRTSCSLPRTLSTQCDNNWLKIFTKIFINEWTNQFLEVCYILFHFFEQCTKITKSCCSCWSMCSQIWWWVNIGHGVTLAEQQKKYSPQEPRTNWGIN